MKNISIRSGILSEELHDFARMVSPAGLSRKLQGKCCFTKKTPIGSPSLSWFKQELHGFCQGVQSQLKAPRLYIELSIELPENVQIKLEAPRKVAQKERF